MAYTRSLFAFLVVVFGGIACSPATYAQDGPVPFTTDQWDFDPGKGAIVQHAGRQSLRLSNTPATLKDVVFRDGVVEVDVSMPDDDRGFAYIQFRKQDEREGEIVYLRMHKSGQSDALQYAPRHNAVTAWQLYHGEGYTALATFSKDAWTRFKIDVRGSEARIYVGEADEPAMVVPDLKRGGEPGAIGLLGSVADGVYFSNFRYTLAGAATPMTPPEPAPPDVLSRWELSRAFADGEVDLDAYPAVAHSEEAGWQAVQSEASGLVNVSRYRSMPTRPSIVLARTTLRAERDQLKKLHVGYSDDVVIYLNEQPVYAGISGYQSRNPTYQGFVTADDVVYLDLKAGDNEVLFVVSEVFGGWGFMARLEEIGGGAP
jgi:hypothetical protein